MTYRLLTVGSTQFYISTWPRISGRYLIKYRYSLVFYLFLKSRLWKEGEETRQEDR